MKDLLKAAHVLGFSSPSIEPDGSDFKIEGREPTNEELILISDKADELEIEYEAGAIDRAKKAEYLKTASLAQIEMIIDALVYPNTEKGNALAKWKEAEKAKFLKENK